MRKPKTDLTAEFVRSILDYGEQSGEFRWRERTTAPREWNTRYAGTIAGSINALGYRQINISGTLYYAHRLAWLAMTGEWPTNEIDHKDLDKANNRFTNLREATHGENGRNRRAYASNTSGAKGVCWDKSRKKWLVSIQVDGKQTSLGRFETMEEAIKARKDGAMRLHGDFARIGQDADPS